jgi:hypothetical protein
MDGESGGRKSRHMPCKTTCPLYPRKWTFSALAGVRFGPKADMCGKRLSALPLKADMCSAQAHVCFALLCAKTDICVLITQQFLKAAYAILSLLQYLARIELQDAESLAPNMHTQPSVPGRTWSLLSHEAIPPTFCTQCSVSCVGNECNRPTVATYFGWRPQI